MTMEQIKEAGSEAYFVDHTAGIYPASAGGIPWTASYIQSTGDTFADLHENLAADATTDKEQPLFPRTRKPLILLAFRHFETFRKNGIPAII